MEIRDVFRKARYALAASVLVVAGCTTTPDSQSNIYVESASSTAQQAPDALSAARHKLADMDPQDRNSATLRWASQYLNEDRPGDANQLLQNIDAGTLDNDALFQWLLFSGRASLAQQQPQATLTLLEEQQARLGSLSTEQRARLDILAADALALHGELLKSLHKRVSVHELLDDDDADYNHEMTWQLLMQLPSETLDSALESSNTELLGWLKLARIYRDPATDLDAQVQRLNRWSTQWRSHPAAKDVPDMLDALEQATSRRPEQVAVLLPESGPLANAGKSLREGMMTAYYQRQEQGGHTPKLSFYDSSGEDIVATYQRAISEGADFVIGPLGKDKATTLAERATFPVATLALNYIDIPQAPDNFFQFGLAPEDEARQIARQGARQGHTQAGILYARGDWGERVANAFEKEWQQLGGTVTASEPYGNGAEIGETVEQMLMTSHSQERGKAISRFTNLDTHNQPRRRQDMGFLFLVANPSQGRQVKPALNFHYAKDLPVYATSLIYAGEDNPRRDRDLNGIRFVDIPWMLESHDSALHQAAQQQWPEGHGRYERLFAMGIDAYRLQGRLFLLDILSSSDVSGATGQLTLKDQRVVRQLSWATFRRGKAERLPQISNSSPGHAPVSTEH